MHGDRQDKQGAARPGWLYGLAARSLSLLLASGTGLLLTLYPQAVLQSGAAPSHFALMICMWGVAAGFVHGVGFVPYNPVLRQLLGPVATWLFTIGGLLLLAR